MLFFGLFICFDTSYLNKNASVIFISRFSFNSWSWFYQNIKPHYMKLTFFYDHVVLEKMKYILRISDSFIVIGRIRIVLFDIWIKMPIIFWTNMGFWILLVKWITAFCSASPAPFLPLLFMFTPWKVRKRTDYLMSTLLFSPWLGLCKAFTLKQVSLSNDKLRSRFSQCYLQTSAERTVWTQRESLTRLSYEILYKKMFYYWSVVTTVSMSSNQVLSLMPTVLEVISRISYWSWGHQLFSYK